MEFSEILNLFKEAPFYSWDLYLLKYNKKSGGSFMLDKASDATYLADEVGDICSSYVEKLMSKFNDVISYQEGLDFKGYLTELNGNDERIKDNFTAFIEAVANSASSISSRYHGYVLAGRDNVNNKDLYIVTKCDPFVNLKSLLITPIGEITEPQLIKLTKRIDCFIYDGAIYADSCKFEKIFGLDSSIRTLCEANRQLVIESKVFNDQSNAILLNNRLLKSFQALDPTNIDNLKNNVEDVKTLKNYAEFSYVADGSINLDTTNSVKLVLKYLCNKVAFRDGKAYEAQTLKPLQPLEAFEEE